MLNGNSELIPINVSITMGEVQKARTSHNGITYTDFRLV
jgi:hypothetical protein